MSILFGAIFLILFAIVLVAISLGMRFLEDQRKRQVKGMLSAVSGEDSEPQQTSILREEEDPLDVFLKKAAFGRRLESAIRLAGLEWTVGKLVMLMLLFGAAGGILGGLFNPFGILWLSIVVPAAGFSLFPYLFLRFKRSQRIAEMEAQLPEALDFLARSMRAGHAFSISLEMLGQETADPLGQEFRTLFNEQNLGAPVEVALENFARRVPLLDIRLFASSVMLQKQTGGNLSEILLRLSYVIRERFRLRGQVKAASAHGRLTSAVLTLLPIFVVVALLFIAPGYLQSMAKDPDGKWMIVGAILGQILGYYVMRRITNIKV